MLHTCVVAPTVPMVALAVSVVSTCNCIIVKVSVYVAYQASPVHVELILEESAAAVPKAAESEPFVKS